FTAGRARTGILAATAIGGFAEVAADDAAPAEFPRRGEVAIAAPATPVVAAADVAIQALGIDAERHRLVVAVDVAADGVAQKAAQHCATDGRAAIAVGDARAERGARQRAEDGAGGGIAAVAALFIAALLVISARRWGRRRGRAITVSAITAIVANAGIMAVAVV